MPLYLFYEYGVGAFKFLNGEFAFVLWDDKQKLLYAVVDHLAIKQLYYSVTDTGIVISSEIQSLIAGPYIKTNINYQSMYDALTLGCCLGIQTMYKHISFIEGGTYVVIKNKSPKVHQYYQLPAYTEMLSNSQFDGTVEKVQSMLETAIQQRTVGQCGLASSLSGGVDSGLISIIAHAYCPDTIMLSGDFPASQDVLQDRQYQFIVAKIHNLPQRLFKETPMSKQKIQLFVKLQDDIAYHPSHYGRIDLVKACVKEKKRVLIVGDGADELFLGYSFYQDDPKLHQVVAYTKTFDKDTKIVVNGGFWVNAKGEITRYWQL